MPEEVVLAFDFECAGGVAQKNGFTQLGASVHELSTGKKLAGFNEYANMMGYEWEDRCVKEFWEKHPERYKDTLEKVESAPLTCEEVVEKFVRWARETCANRKCVILSDNMIYDGGLLKHFAKVDVLYLLGRRSVYFETSSVYYGMHMMHKRARIDESSDDLSSKEIALDAVRAFNKDANWPEHGPSHDHNPENDAENMARKWIYIQQQFSTM